MEEGNDTLEHPLLDRLRVHAYTSMGLRLQQLSYIADNSLLLYPYLGDDRDARKASTYATAYPAVS